MLLGMSRKGRGNFSFFVSCFRLLSIDDKDCIDGDFDDLVDDFGLDSSISATFLNLWFANTRSCSWSMLLSFGGMISQSNMTLPSGANVLTVFLLKLMLKWTFRFRLELLSGLLSIDLIVMFESLWEGLP